jgi:hypothetical protein
MPNDGRDFKKVQPGACGSVSLFRGLDCDPAAEKNAAWG